ncbi:MAG: hypothetical protein H6679_06060, partial [Epsilonproteobacteria bacterium]|nr:hypothetical protein [Campylobacterota bacterium]
MMKRSLWGVLYSLLILWSTSLFAGFNFSHKNSTVSVGDAKFLVNQQITGWNGTLIQDGSVTGQPIVFDNGCLEKNGTPALIKGTYDGDSGGQITLNQDEKVRVDPGQFMPSVTVLRSGNRLEGQPIFSNMNGVTLLHELSELTVAVNGKFGSNIVLNNGRVILDSDLHLADDKTISGSGRVNLNNRRVTFGGSDQKLTHSIFWEDATDIVLYAKMTLAGTWTIKGAGSEKEAHIIGNGNVLDLTESGSIWIKAGTRLVLSDLKVKGLGKGAFVFEDDDCQLCLSNVEMELANSYTFTNGGMYVERSSTIVTKDGFLAFDQNASLTIDGSTLWYDPLTFPRKNNIQPLVDSAQNSNNKFVKSLNFGRVSGVCDDDDDDDVTECCKHNSNAILKVVQDVTNNSNTILTKCDEIKHNSDA